MPHAVLDVVAEDPEIEHVAGEVHEAAMHEHGAQHGHDRWYDADPAGQVGPVEEYGRDEAEGVDRPLSALRAERELPQENENAGADQTDGDDRLRARGVVVPQWNHGGLEPFASLRGRLTAAPAV